MNRTTGRDRESAGFKSTVFQLAVIACFILVLLIFFVIKFNYVPGWDFRNNLWAPSFLLLQGQSPYNISVLYEAGTAIWMPVAIGIFWPIGLLSLQQASNLWWLISLVSLIAIVWLSSGQKRPRKLLFILTLFMAFLFPPTISHFSLGQITILICLIFMAIAVCEHNLPPFLIAAMLALTLAKPQLAIFVLPGFFFSYLRENGIYRTLVLIIYSGLAAGITSLPLFFFFPQWIFDFIHNQMVNPVWAHPSSLYILETTFNETGRVLWWLLLILASAVNLWLWRHLPKREAAAWSLALTTLVTPYVWSWDFVFLIPLLITYLFRKMPKYSTGILYLGTGACWAALTYMKFDGLISDELYWWVPWYLVGLIVIAGSLDWAAARQRTNPSHKIKMWNLLASNNRGKETEYRT